VPGCFSYLGHTCFRKLIFIVFGIFFSDFITKLRF